jgi:flagellar hook protein FlgE
METRSWSVSLPDWSAGFLINEAGFKLLGYPLSDTPPLGAAGPFETYPVNINKLALTASPSSEGSFTANLDSRSALTDPADLPSQNGPGSVVDAKKSMVVFDQLGSAVTLDLYFNKVSDASWEVSVFDRGTAGPAGGFPYGSGPLVTESLTFDATGKLPPGSMLSIAVPGGEPLSLDISNTT